jgi:hypothetical protein
MTGAETPACDEKERLLRRYEFASSDYHRSILVLTQRRGVLPKKEYEDIKNFIEATKAELERARQSLDRHIAEHGC